MAKPRFRHEIKHYINYSDYLSLRNRLRVVINSDSNVDNVGKYKIRSIYFDNLQDKVLREKIYGINNREKFRIRYYNEDSSFIKLEKKSKVNGLCSKISTIITRDQCEKILNGDIKWMKKSEDALMVELYTKMNYQRLKPKTIVDYVREPYVYRTGNVRITIDSEIKTGVYSKDLFNQDLPVIECDSKGIIILEVKYDEFLPNIIKDIIQINNRRQSSFSKYAACRVFG